MCVSVVLSIVIQVKMLNRSWTVCVWGHWREVGAGDVHFKVNAV